ncbi:hypothetical protein BT69DRAFT_1331625 [Atractiella rhizophila]|nr:hypothetical protein BT69DRAFT_1331625 [Atractiella rhizophila]
MDSPHSSPTRQAHRASTLTTLQGKDVCTPPRICVSPGSPSKKKTLREARAVPLTEKDQDIWTRLISAPRGNGFRMFRESEEMKQEREWVWEGGKNDGELKREAKRKFQLLAPPTDLDFDEVQFVVRMCKGQTQVPAIANMPKAAFEDKENQVVNVPASKNDHLIRKVPAVVDTPATVKAPTIPACPESKNGPTSTQKVEVSVVKQEQVIAPANAPQDSQQKTSISAVNILPTQDGERTTEPEQVVNDLTTVRRTRSRSCAIKLAHTPYVHADPEVVKDEVEAQGASRQSQTGTAVPSGCIPNATTEITLSSAGKTNISPSAKHPRDSTKQKLATVSEEEEEQIPATPHSVKRLASQCKAAKILRKRKIAIHIPDSPIHSTMAMCLMQAVNKKSAKPFPAKEYPMLDHRNSEYFNDRYTFVIVEEAEHTEEA